MPKKICHITSAHTASDARIFFKECQSLSAAGYETHLVASATAGEVQHIGLSGSVTLHPIPNSFGRCARITLKTVRCLRKAIALDCSLYHFHDPELIPSGVVLSLLGKKVIYDVHEDVPRDILTKHWINSWIKGVISRFVELIEALCAKYFFAVVAATPTIEKRFKRTSADVTLVKNYPRLEESSSVNDWEAKKSEVCYVGAISRDRGVLDMCNAMAKTSEPVTLNLAGRFNEPNLRAAAVQLDGWGFVNELGFLNRHQLSHIYSRSVAGLVVLHPLANYLEALPVKMFEYMNAGIPIIASDFPLWRKIVEEAECGLLVDPQDPLAIAEAIDRLVLDRALAKSLGNNGRRAVEQRCNWGVEEEKLLKFYERLLRKRTK